MSPTPTKKPAKRKLSIKKIILIILLLPIVFVLGIVAWALISAPLEKPVYVNRDLSFENKLKIPELLQPKIENGEKVFDLTAQTGETEFLDGLQTKTIGFNGSYLGPTIRASTGDKIRMNVSNTLAAPTTVHWHGMDLPASMDGGPHQMVAAGGSWRPNWTIANQASTLWYHSHMVGKTGEQVYRGLAGFFLIDDQNSSTLELPKTYGVDDIPLAVQDRQLDSDGQFVYQHMHMDTLGHTGMHGDKILVNGTYAPYVDVAAKQIRLRVLNASNARRYNFKFDDNRQFQQIASDGGLLAAPVARTNMILAPGERAEIVVNMTGSTKPVVLMSDEVREENTVLWFVKRILSAPRDENQMFKILELRPRPTDDSTQPIPTKLNTIQKIQESSAVKTRLLRLDSPTSINGKSMNHNVVNEIVRSGDTEIWNVRNDSGTYHPFHIHGVQFQILGWNDRSATDYESGWKDTVLVPNGETAKLIMRFPAYSDPHIPYMYHCHILEHEDAGMMGQFVVIGKDIKDTDVYIEKNTALDNYGHGPGH